MASQKTKLSSLPQEGVSRHQVVAIGRDDKGVPTATIKLSQFQADLLSKTGIAISRASGGAKPTVTFNNTNLKAQAGAHVAIRYSGLKDGFYRLAHVQASTASGQLNTSKHRQLGVALLIAKADMASVSARPSV